MLTWTKTFPKAGSIKWMKKWFCQKVVIRVRSTFKCKTNFVFKIDNSSYNCADLTTYRQIKSIRRKVFLRKKRKKWKRLSRMRQQIQMEAVVMTDIGRKQLIVFTKIYNSAHLLWSQLISVLKFYRSYLLNILYKNNQTFGPCDQIWSGQKCYSIIPSTNYLYFSIYETKQHPLFFRKWVGDTHLSCFLPNKFKQHSFDDCIVSLVKKLNYTLKPYSLFSIKTGYYQRAVHFICKL